MDAWTAAELEGRRALAELASQSAQRAWQARDLERAAALTRACLDLDPGRAALWQQRQEAITAAAARASLATQTAVRLEAAGIEPGDPALQRIREHNRARGIQPAARPEAGPEAEAGS